MEMQYKFMLLKRLIKNNLPPMELLLCILYVIDPEKVRSNLVKIRNQLNEL